MKPLCFVLMPFGKKRDSKKGEIDFDTIYDKLVKPAIAQADMEAIRADEETVGGIIHKPMFERLLMCEYAIVDLTSANANVFYELGVRHASKPYSTLSIMARDSILPFDVRPLRAYQYGLDGDNNLSNTKTDIEQIAKRLNSAREKSVDSPIYQFFDELKPHFLPHEKTDVFREMVRYSNNAKSKLASFRHAKDISGLRNFEESLRLQDTEGGILIDLFLSYRALEAWGEMINLACNMPEYLQKSLMVREQLGLALNRAGKTKEAEDVLSKAIAEYGENSETCGILGRVYKDRYKQEANPALKEAYLKQAIDMYIRGFEADWRDAYPGVNAVSLMYLLQEPDVRFEELSHAVRYSVKQKIKAKKQPDYWDFATLMELEVMNGNIKEARELLLKALPLANETFMPKTTADTLKMIKAKKPNDGLQIQEIIDSLESKILSI